MSESLLDLLNDDGGGDQLPAGTGSSHGALQQDGPTSPQASMQHMMQERQHQQLGLVQRRDGDTSVPQQQVQQQAGEQQQEALQQQQQQQGPSDGSGAAEQLLQLPNGVKVTQEQYRKLQLIWQLQQQQQQQQQRRVLSSSVLPGLPLAPPGPPPTTAAGGQWLGQGLYHSARVEGSQALAASLLPHQQQQQGSGPSSPPMSLSSGGSSSAGDMASPRTASHRQQQQQQQQQQGPLGGGSQLDAVLHIFQSAGSQQPQQQGQPQQQQGQPQRRVLPSSLQRLQGVGDRQRMYQQHPARHGTGGGGHQHSHVRPLTTQPQQPLQQQRHGLVSPRPSVYTAAGLLDTAAGVAPAPSPKRPRQEGGPGSDLMATLFPEAAQAYAAGMRASAGERDKAASASMGTASSGSSIHVAKSALGAASGVEWLLADNGLGNSALSAYTGQQQRVAAAAGASIPPLPSQRRLPTSLTTSGPGLGAGTSRLVTTTFTYSGGSRLGGGAAGASAAALIHSSSTGQSRGVLIPWAGAGAAGAGSSAGGATGAGGVGYLRRSGAESQAALKAVFEGLNVAEGERDVPEKSMAVPILKHQRLALHWMCCREVSARVSGGILADDQGLGKTVTTIALILSHPRNGDYLVTEALGEEDDDDPLQEGEELRAISSKEVGTAGAISPFAHLGPQHRQPLPQQQQQQQQQQEEDADWRAILDSLIDSKPAAAAGTGPPGAGSGTAGVIVLDEGSPAPAKRPRLDPEQQAAGSGGLMLNGSSSSEGDILEVVDLGYHPPAAAAAGAGGDVAMDAAAAAAEGPPAAAAMAVKQEVLAGAPADANALPLGVGQGHSTAGVGNSSSLGAGAQPSAAPAASELQPALQAGEGAVGEGSVMGAAADSMELDTPRLQQQTQGQPAHGLATTASTPATAAAAAAGAGSPAGISVVPGNGSTAAVAASPAVTDSPSPSPLGKGGAPQAQAAPSKQRKPCAAVAEYDASGLVAGGTLVVCPTSVLHQWAKEVADKVHPLAGCSLHVYHGKDKASSPALLATFTVVVTTYGTLGQEAPAKERQALRIRKQGTHAAPIDLCSILDEEEEEGTGAAAAAAAASGEDSKGGSKAGSGATGGAGKGRKRSATPLSREGGPLYGVRWHRVVLDEAQSIKNSRTLAAAACWALVARHRWCLSGTPIQNSVEDVYSYFKFLRYQPYDTAKGFKVHLKDAITYRPEKGYARLQAVLAAIMLRRTKDTQLHGRPIIELPKREQTLVQVQLSAQEKEFYQQVEAQTKEELARLSAAGGGAGNSYVNMLYLLLRLRQACNHPWLVKGAGQTFRRKAGTASAAQLAAVRRLAPDTRNALLAALRGHQSQCPVCGDVPEDAVVTRCGHVYCQQCVAAQQCMAAQQEADNGSEGEFTCQACSSVVPKEDVFSGVALEAEASPPPPDAAGGAAAGASSAAAAGGPRNLAEEQWASSSKVDKLLALLEEVRNRNKGTAGANNGAGAGRPSGINMLIGRSRGDAAIAKQLRQVSPDGTAGAGGGSGRARPEKVIVFSQWTSMLDLMEIPLKKGRYQFRRLDGTMSVLQRQRAIEEFEGRDDVLLLLVSLKAAALGVNLTAANHVVLMDLWWNPATEEQAIDRAHRIGQTRTVQVTRLTVPGTVEERILALQESKRQLISSAMTGKEGLGGARLSKAELEALLTQDV